MWLFLSCSATPNGPPPIGGNPANSSHPETQNCEAIAAVRKYHNCSLLAMRSLSNHPPPQTQNCEAIAIVRNKLIACNESIFFIIHPIPLILPKTQNCEAIAIVQNKLIACNEIPHYPLRNQFNSFSILVLMA
jgi:hypothetical protein